MADIGATKAVITTKGSIAYGGEYHSHWVDYLLATE